MIKNPIQGYSEQGKPLLGNTWSCLLSSWSTPWLSQPPSPMDTPTAQPWCSPGAAPSHALQALKQHGHGAGTAKAAPEHELGSLKHGVGVHSPAKKDHPRSCSLRFRPLQHQRNTATPKIRRPSWEQRAAALACGDGHTGPQHSPGFTFLLTRAAWSLGVLPWHAATVLRPAGKNKPRDLGFF